MTENQIVGEALIALKHDELKEMGMTSVGHRLTLLKNVYDVKIRQDVPIDAEHYVPLCTLPRLFSVTPVAGPSIVLTQLDAPSAAEADVQDATATQADIARIIDSIRLRDERIIRAESELMRLTEEYRLLRKELLPVFTLVKGPLPPHPNGFGYGQYDMDHSMPMGVTSAPQVSEKKTGISRKLSTKMMLGLTPKTSSPTHVPPSIQEGKDMNGKEPSLAATTASNHLIASMTGERSQLSPGQQQLPSPTSPPHHRNGPTLAQQTFGHPSSYPRSAYTQADEISFAQQSFVSDYRGGTPNPNVSRQPTPSQAHQQREQLPQQEAPRSDGSNAPNGGIGQGNSSVEIFKSFRVSMDDPCYKVLPEALKKYNINADWKQYALYIVYGDEERCLELEEKPLKLFKQLDNEGRKPMFMLRKVTGGDGSGQHPHLGLGGFIGQPSNGQKGRNQAYQSGVQLLPGGVL